MGDRHCSLLCVPSPVRMCQKERVSCGYLVRKSYRELQAYCQDVPKGTCQLWDARHWRRRTARGVRMCQKERVSCGSVHPSDRAVNRPSGCAKRNVSVVGTLLTTFRRTSRQDVPKGTCQLWGVERPMRIEIVEQSGCAKRNVSVVGPCLDRSQPARFLVRMCQKERVSCGLDDRVMPNVHFQG